MFLHLPLANQTVSPAPNGCHWLCQFGQDQTNRAIFCATDSAAFSYAYIDTCKGGYYTLCNILLFCIFPGGPLLLAKK